jgi:hypothetical protein
MEKKTLKKKNKNGNKKISKKSFEIKKINKYHYEFDKLKKNYLNSQKTQKDIIKIEELSTQLLLKLDMIEINGNQDLRNHRKNIVNSINTYIDNLR